MLIPGLNIFAIFMFFFILFHLGLIKEKSKNNNEEKYVDDTKHKKYILNGIILHLLIGLSISISFLIILNYLIVLLIIISIPFKYIPLKYYFGVLNFK